MTIGICGTGRMGAAIGERLLDEGEQLAVWNRTEARTRTLVERGATRLESPAALAGACATVIVMVLDERAQDAVYDGPGGLLHANLNDVTVIDMSTVSPASVPPRAHAVRARGGAFVECPVGGTVTPARTGKLLGMAGGSAGDVARVRPLLEKLCRRVEHVGEPGAGASMKLAINLPLIVYWEALGESLALCDAAGIDLDLAGDILADSSGAIGVAKARIPSILDALRGAEPAPPNFALAGSAKDLGLAVDAAAQAGGDAPVARAALAAVQAAVADGWGERDFPMQAAWRAGRRAGR